MRDFLIRILGWRINEGGISIELFSIWHFLYIALIAGGIIGLAFYLKGKSEEKNQST